MLGAYLLAVLGIAAILQTAFICQSLQAFISLHPANRVQVEHPHLSNRIRPNKINELYHEIAEKVSLEHLDLICEALECNLNDLITREPNKESKIVHTRTGSSKSDENR